MTAKPKRTCDECRYDGGWHYSDGHATRCPNYYTADAAEQAKKLTADAHAEAFKKAKLVIADAAETMPEFSANSIREQLDGIDSPVIGAAFSASVRAGVIEATGRMVPSTDEATHSHRIYVWRSLRYGRRAAS